MNEIEENVRKILELLGEAKAEVLENTPRRVAKFLQSRYTAPEVEFKVFESDYTGEVHLQGIRVNAICQHHFLPFFGSADVWYKPNGLIAGLSKVVQLVDCHSRRPTLQEELTKVIAEDLALRLGTEVRVQIVAVHSCLAARYSAAAETTTTTLAVVQQ